jgi:hypothetical protein
MWQDFLVYAILALAGAACFWKFYRKLTGKSPCCGSECGCSSSCPSGGERSACGRAEGGLKLAPLSGNTCRAPK